MAGVLDSVNQRTQLVGKNRLELLLFQLKSDQLYGVNVFKVREVIQCPHLTVMPKMKSGVIGIAHIRDSSIPILDLAVAMRDSPIEKPEEGFVIITEYNQVVLGFLVNKVERIVNTNWEEIHPPPQGSGSDHYLTAVTELDGKLVEILDVEKILAEVAPRSEEVSSGIRDAVRDKQRQDRVLIVDDSMVARKQVERCLVDLGVEVIAKKNGREAWEYLKSLANDGIVIKEHFLLIISDIEMPEMDGYTLTSSIRQDDRMTGIYILLHTSLSGVFNESMVRKVGADAFLAKFQPDKLASVVHERME